MVAFEEALELAEARRVTELADRLGLDLADALASDLEDRGRPLRACGVAIAEAVAEFDDLPFALRQAGQHLVHLLLEHLWLTPFRRVLGRLVFDEVAEVAVLPLADGRVERDRVAAIFSTRRARHRHVARSWPILRWSARGPAPAELFLRRCQQLAHRLDHVHRDADRAGLVGDGAGDGLANPPGGIGARTCSRGDTRTSRPPASGRCCLPGSDPERTAAVAVFFGDGNDQTQIGFACGLWPGLRGQLRHSSAPKGCTEQGGHLPFCESRHRGARRL